jgi:hypothetical protein
MTNDQKIEAYSLIMEFMGIGPRMVSPDRYSISKRPWFTTIKDTPEQCIESAAASDGLKYFSSWDALMPVIEKIYEAGFDTEEALMVRDGLVELNITNTVYKIVEFIKAHTKATEPKPRLKLYEVKVTEKYSGTHYVYAHSEDEASEISAESEFETGGIEYIDHDAKEAKSVIGGEWAFIKDPDGNIVTELIETIEN